MAAQKHLDIFAKGVEVWNKWRREFATAKARATQRCGSRIVSDILDHISVTFNTIASLDVTESPIF